ncbi:hypothetical protein R5W23_000884 [Gemmata sp. JC673]|uniref:DUF4328 domain-containing protein n=1 Tax=Gemmata algarum TaxID=2975278 RepID=A0ABU5EX14_9BACT|nr:DUF4328 domain-containing protein [Gemmata algarum]MDY3559726.1 hypothetical protein [Gemmata algarum]
MFDSDFLGVLCGLGCFVTSIVLAIVLGAGFLSALQRALLRVEPENRRMSPGQVWLNLIPIFNLVWCTVTVERVAESLRNEFLARQMHSRRETYGRTRGFTLLTLLASGVLFYPAFITYPIAFVYAILYWRQISRYAEQLKPGAYAPPPTDEAW